VTPDPLYQFRVGEAVFWEVPMTVAFAVLGAAAAVWFFKEIRRTRTLSRRAIWGASFALVLPVLAVDAGLGIRRAHALLDRESWQFTCGPLEQFVTEDRVNTGYERFVVNGVAFRYSDHGPPTGLGYHRTMGRGGIMRPDLTVRIAYVAIGENNVIVRVESWSPDTSGTCSVSQ